MKKILLLAATLLMGVCSWAQSDPVAVTSLSDFEDGMTVLLKNAKDQSYLYTANGALKKQVDDACKCVIEMVSSNTCRIQFANGSYLSYNDESDAAYEEASQDNATVYTIIAQGSAWRFQFSHKETTYQVAGGVEAQVTSWSGSDGAVRRNWTVLKYPKQSTSSFEGVATLSKSSFTTLSDLNGLQITYVGATSLTKDESGMGMVLTNEDADEMYAMWNPATGECTIDGNVVTISGFEAGEEFSALPTENCTLYLMDNGSFLVDDEEAEFDRVAINFVAPTEGPTGETVATYTISSPRGDLFTDGNGYLLSTRSTTLANSRTTTNDKWVIINAKSNEYGVYIYNVEHKTFIGSNNMNAGNVVKAPMVEQPTMLYRWLTGSTDETVKNNAYNDKQYKETDYPWCIAEEYGKVNNNYYSINVCNWDASSNNTGLRLDKTSKYDDGNIFQIVEAGTISKADYEAIYNMIYGEASAEEVAEANELLAKTGAGYPSDDADARTALSTLLAQEEISKPDLASAIAAYKASTEIEMPKAGSTYYVEAQFVDGTSAVMTAKEGVLTFTKENSEKEASYVTVVTVDNSDVTMTIGTQYVHITCGSDAPNKEADVDGLSEEVATLTLVAGGSEQFGRFLLQGQASSGSKYYLTTRDDLDGTFAFVANTPADKFYDDNYNHNGHNRTSYYTFTEKKGDTTGISAVAPVVAGKAIFNLQGQRIQKLQKGINIVGGQKVVR